MAEQQYPKGEDFRNWLAEGGQDPEGCEHLNKIQSVTPDNPAGCQQCLDMGDSWVNLRICLVCGQVGCCDNSKNKHATHHHKETGHEFIQSYQPDEEWVWCFVDEMLIGP